MSHLITIFVTLFSLQTFAQSHEPDAQACERLSWSLDEISPMSTLLCGIVGLNDSSQLFSSSATSRGLGVGGLWACESAKSDAYQRARNGCMVHASLNGGNPGECKEISTFRTDVYFGDSCSAQSVFYNSSYEVK